MQMEIVASREKQIAFPQKSCVFRTRRGRHFRIFFRGGIPRKLRQMSHCLPPTASTKTGRQGGETHWSRRSISFTANAAHVDTPRQDGKACCRSQHTRRREVSLDTGISQDSRQKLLSALHENGSICTVSEKRKVYLHRTAKVQPTVAKFLKSKKNSRTTPP